MDNETQNEANVQHAEITLSRTMVDKEELKRFYKQDLLGLIKKIFLIGEY